MNSLNASQIQRLQAQISAFRRLSRNIPLTPQVLNSIGFQSQHEAEEKEEKVCMKASPQNQPNTAQIINQLTQEHEKRIRKRILARVNELRLLLPLLKQGTKAYFEARNELKRIELIDLQRKLRAHVITEMRSIQALDATCDPTPFLRLSSATSSSIAASNYEFRVNSLAMVPSSIQQKIESGRVNSILLRAVIEKQRNWKSIRAIGMNIRARICKNILRYFEGASIRMAQKERLENAKKLADCLRDLSNNDLERQKIIETTKVEKLNELALICEEKRTEKSDTNNHHNHPHHIAILPFPGERIQPYEVDGIRWLVSQYENGKCSVLADEIGIAKQTMVAGLLCHAVENKGDQGPFLIAAPKESRKLWISELQRLTPQLPLLVYTETTGRITVDTPNLIVLTTEELAFGPRSPLAGIEWTILVLDEGVSSKNSRKLIENASISKHFLETSNHRVLLLNSPPCESDPEDLWPILNFVFSISRSDPTIDNWIAPPFVRTIEGTQMIWKLTEDERKLIAETMFETLTHVMLRRTKKDVEGQLPQIIEINVCCNASALQKVLYQSVCEHGIISLSPTSESAIKAQQRVSHYQPNLIQIPSLGNPFAQLLRICSHPYLFFGGYMWDENIVRSSGKLEALDQLLRKHLSSGHRVIIFSKIPKILEIIEQYTHLRHFSSLKIDPQADPSVRANVVESWNSPSSSYLILILGVEADKLGISNADVVIEFDSTWHPNRITPFNSNNSTLRIIRLTTIGSIEEHFLSPQQESEIIIAATLGQMPHPERGQELLELLLDRFNKSADVEDDVLHPIANPGPLFNHVLSNSEEELMIFNKLDSEEELQSAKDPNKLSRLLDDSELPQSDQILQAIAQQIQQQQQQQAMEHRPPPPSISPPSLELVSAAAVALADHASVENREDLIKHIVAETASVTKKKKDISQKTSSTLTTTTTPKQQQQQQLSNSVSTTTNLKSSYSSQNKQLQERCLCVWKAVQGCKEHGRNRSKLFMTLPTKVEHPDYYQLIEKPVSLKQVRVKKYHNSEDFAIDMQLVFSNARRYHQIGSQSYLDAEMLLNVFVKEFTKAFGKPPIPITSTAIQQPPPSKQPQKQQPHDVSMEDEDNYDDVEIGTNEVDVEGNNSNNQQDNDDADEENDDESSDDDDDDDDDSDDSDDVQTDHEQYYHNFGYWPPPPAI